MVCLRQEGLHWIRSVFSQEPFNEKVLQWQKLLLFKLKLTSIYRIVTIPQRIKQKYKKIFILIK